MLAMTITLLTIARRLEDRWIRDTRRRPVAAGVGRWRGVARMTAANRATDADRPTAPATGGPPRSGSTGIGVFLFIYLPLGVVVLYAFHDANIVAWPFRPFTLRWFAALAHDRGMLDAAVASLKLALLATLLALGVGVPGAFVLDRLDFPGKAAFERLVLLPLILPGVITGVALLTFFSFVGLSLSSGFPLVPGWPVVLGHGAALTSIVVTQVYARLRRFDRVLEEASQDLYANAVADLPLRDPAGDPLRGAGQRAAGLHPEPRRDRGDLLPGRPAEYRSAADLGPAPPRDHAGGERRRDRDLRPVGGGDRAVGEDDAGRLGD